MENFMDLKYIALIIALVVSTVSMPLIILFSKKFNLYDTVDGRKVHTGQISRLGGLGITLAFSIALIILMATGHFADIKQNILFLVLAAICITIMGIIDDIVTLPAKTKLLTQIIASSLVLIGGFKFTTLSFGIYTLNLGLFAYPLTFVWIIGVTNAVNLIDGIDGQCGGLSVLASFTFCLFFFSALLWERYLMMHQPFRRYRLLLCRQGNRILRYSLRDLYMYLRRTRSSWKA
jgi:UDP-GlcNAc:undecaprenyl-phosphate GlcNAc-1-phosphate transferase